MVNPKNASGNCSCAARKARADAFQSHFPTRINVALKTVGISHRGGVREGGRRGGGKRGEKGDKERRRGSSCIKGWRSRRRTFMRRSETRVARRDVDAHGKISRETRAKKTRDDEGERMIDRSRGGGLSAGPSVFGIVRRGNARKGSA